MSTLKLLELTISDSAPLNPITQSFLPLIPPSLHACLRGKNPANISDTQIIAIGAFTETGLPVGVLLATHVAYIHLLDVLCLYVQPEYRNQGLGSELLAFLEKEAKAQRGKLITFTYADEAADTPAIEKILTVNNWHLGKPFLLRCQFDGFTFNPPWIHKKVSYPANFEVIPLSQLSEKDKKNICHREENREFPALISPFFEYERMEPLNSLMLKHNDRIVAWVLTHRLSADTIRYSALYAEHFLHFQGYGAQLLIQSIWLQKQSSIKWAVFELPLRQVSNSWTRFVKRRLVPFADKTTYLLQAWQVL